MEENWRKERREWINRLVAEGNWSSGIGVVRFASYSITLLSILVGQWVGIFPLYYHDKSPILTGRFFLPFPLVAFFRRFEEKRKFHA